MAEAGKDERVRPTVTVGGNGNVAFADMRDIEPRSATTSIVTGAVGGAAVGSVLAGGYLAKSLKAVEEAGKNIAEKSGSASEVINEVLNAAEKSRGKVALAVVAGAAVIGAILHYAPTRVHNQWSKRVASATLDKQQQQGQVMG